ncbi:hypothetical protein NDU88_005922 [Pleurodeles waltl]|uniref:Uncharacterized protein n=1 Tax=Pleurodeles waltl TaxID=8319 RepID=A0AAV7LP05_PLEWA|nr:hypothetical protein NDU88_005922 [Pleurodeles waltl]
MLRDLSLRLVGWAGPAADATPQASVGLLVPAQLPTDLVSNCHSGSVSISGRAPPVNTDPALFCWGLGLSTLPTATQAYSTPSPDSLCLLGPTQGGCPHLTRATSSPRSGVSSLGLANMALLLPLAIGQAPRLSQLRRPWPAPQQPPGHLQHLLRAAPRAPPTLLVGPPT